MFDGGSSNSGGNPIKLSKAFRTFQSGEISPNLVTPAAAATTIVLKLFTLADQSHLYS